MHGSPEQFQQSISRFLGGYYLAISLMNLIAAHTCWHYLKKRGQALVWLAVATGLAAMSIIAFLGRPEWMAWISIPPGVRDFVDGRLASATVFTLGTFVCLTLLYLFRKFFVRPVVAWSMLNVSLLLMGFSLLDEDFAAIITKADNVSIVVMIYLFGYFTWLATYQAVRNDERFEQGLEPLEKLNSEKVLVWPDLVYIELICMVALTAILIVWAISVKAPLEEAASSVKTPNPSKAPWYFLGLQEMLVYFDPWIAGVVLPSLVIFGLMAIPYLDFNRDGNGYYTIKQRRFAYVVFQFGFLGLWVLLIVLGTFLRGPNWSFFGPYEHWDPHKVVALNPVDLSQYFWIQGLEMRMPRAPEDAGALTRVFYILWRELPGILVTLAYFLLVPTLLAMTVLRKFFVRMGFVRFMVMSFLLLVMGLLPLKMVLQWTVNMRYIISIPEYYLNL